MDNRWRFLYPGISEGVTKRVYPSPLMDLGTSGIADIKSNAYIKAKT